MSGLRNRFVSSEKAPPKATALSSGRFSDRCGGFASFWAHLMNEIFRGSTMRTFYPVLAEASNSKVRLVHTGALARSEFTMRLRAHEALVSEFTDQKTEFHKLFMTVSACLCDKKQNSRLLRCRTKHSGCLLSLIIGLAHTPMTGEQLACYQGLYNILSNGTLLDTFNVRETGSHCPDQ